MSKGLLVFSTLFLLVFFAGCKVQYVPIETIKEVHTIDSVYLRDTTIQYRIEKEYIRDFTDLLDTLRMETAYSNFVAWVDTSEVKLSGTARNKSENVINIPVQVKEKVTVRDSIVYQDRPVPVEVEKVVHPVYEKWLWGWLVFSLLAFFAFLFCKFKKMG